MGANTRYKDSMFTKLFSNHHHLLELYNALTDSSYDASSNIIINTLPDILFRERKNDISFLLDNKLVVLLEHQSTINENMPLRFLLYIARLYEKITDIKTIYRQKQLTIPRPEFMVLYNGIAPYPEKTILRLSDAFEKVESSTLNNLELVAPVININAGVNEQIAKKSKVLYDYSAFVAAVRRHEKTQSLTDAVKQAVKECIKQGILEDFLVENSSEVCNMILTAEWDWKIAEEVWREEAHETGLQEGREEGLREGMQEGERKKALEDARNLRSLGVSDKIISQATGLTLDEITAL
jgi:hypothetical protein